MELEIKIDENLKEPKITISSPTLSDEIKKITEILKNSFTLENKLIDKVSEVIQTLIKANGIFSMILLSIVHAVEESIEVRKINKKIKENK